MNDIETAIQSLPQNCKLVVAGGRHYRLCDFGQKVLQSLAQTGSIAEVVCGGATGADEVGKQWAISENIEVKMFPADWNKHGRAAGPIRNQQMAEYADAVLLFPGGRGTESMHRCAVQEKLIVIDLRDI